MNRRTTRGAPAVAFLSLAGCKKGDEGGRYNYAVRSLNALRI